MTARKALSAPYFLLLLAISAGIASIGVQYNPLKEAADKTVNINESYGRLPLYFIENKGQVDAKVRFYEKGPGHAAYFTKEGVYLSLIPSPQSPKASESIRLSFVGANVDPHITPEGLQQGRVNYFIGSDPSKWRTDIPAYSSVLYKDVYKGVDLRFYGTNRALEYDVVVKPGADPSLVKFSYEGIGGLSISDNGDLEIILRHGKIVQKKPYIYQEIDGKRMEVAGSFVVSPVTSPQSPVPNSYSFALASYDKTRALVIDPVLAYSTYIGGGDEDYGRGIAVDPAGNAYLTGYTASPDFPTTNLVGGARGENDPLDVFVVKIDPSGSALVYSTYLGGSGSDYGYGIAVDPSGNAYVAGHTLYSHDFPLKNAVDKTFSGSNDAFVAKIDPSGRALVYSTYLGGGDENYGYAIAVDSSGSAYVTGLTRSRDFPLKNPIDRTPNYYDAFVTKIDPSGQALVYSTYLGGTGADYGYGIAVDPSGSAYVTGHTYSSDFPTVNALERTRKGSDDVFITKIDPSGSKYVYSTYLGGVGKDRGHGIAVDSSGSAYVTGFTRSRDFPLKNPIDSTINYYDVFVVKMAPSGQALVYSTYLGGGNEDYGRGIAVDSSGNAYVTGDTYSYDFPVENAIDKTYSHIIDVFVMKIDPSGSALIYSTYIGGSSEDHGYGIAVDSSGNAYVTGDTHSRDFPLKDPIDGTFAYHDAFVFKMGGP